MATSLKRKYGSGDGQDADCKKKVDFGDEYGVKQYLTWCQENNYQLSPKVAVRRDGSCAQCGMLAVDDIAEGYCLFQVPRSVLLSPENSDIADLLEAEKSKLTARNQWIPLLITLLHESAKAAGSKWAPYLALAPDPDAIDLPMFWEKTDVDILGGTGVDTAVERDLRMIESDFNELVLPFVQKHKGTVRCDNVNLDSFKRMVAFVMAYSFTEPAGKEKKNCSGGCCQMEQENEEEEEESDDDDEQEEKMLPPMMVPLADMLNHVTNNNAKLTFGTEALKMVTTRPIKKGEEIYNTYGQVSNLHLMHMYGFAEPFPDNTNDVVEIPATLLVEAARGTVSDGDESGLKLVDSKWKKLQEQDIIDEDEMIILGQDGIMNDDVCSQVLKVLSMSQSEFARYVENEGWSDAESEASDAEDSSLDIAKCSQLSQEQKLLLKKMCELHAESYAVSRGSAEEQLKKGDPLPLRQRYTLLTAHGQQMLLHKLIAACSL